MQRYGQVLGVKPERFKEYAEIHANVWPEVLAMIHQCNIRNYSIYLKQTENLLFGYWEYHGSDFAADAALIAADPRTQDWWAVCTPCQDPLATRKDGEWWAMMDEVFHHD